MSNPSYPLWADPSDPGRDKADDPVRRAGEGHGEDSANELGTEVGEASDDDVNHTIISAATVERATENLHAQDGPSDS